MPDGNSSVCGAGQKCVLADSCLLYTSDSLGLSAAIEAKDAVAEINASNRSDAVLAHEGTHWQDNDILSGIQTGKLMVKPDHHYALKMISEMKARMAEAKVKGKDAAQGLATFEQEC